MSGRPQKTAVSQQQRQNGRVPSFPPANAIRLDYRTTSSRDAISDARPLRRRRGGGRSDRRRRLPTKDDAGDRSPDQPAAVSLIYRVIGALSGAVAAFVRPTSYDVVRLAIFRRAAFISCRSFFCPPGHAPRPSTLTSPSFTRLTFITGL